MAERVSRETEADISDLLRQIKPPGYRGKRFGFEPEYLKMSAKTEALFPRKEASPDEYAGLPVVVDQWMPDGFVAVIGPPTDRHSDVFMDRLPQIAMLNVTENGSLDLP